MPWLPRVELGWQVGSLGTFAREQIRDCIAQYNWSGDAGRIGSVVATFSTEGVLETPSSSPVHGQAAIAEFLHGVAASFTAPPGIKPIVRHDVANTRFTYIETDRAETTSYYTVFTNVGLDHMGRYRDTFIREGETWLIERRRASLDWFSEDSPATLADSGNQESTDDRR